MAYKILGKSGIAVKHNDSFVFGSDIETVKIMELDEKEMTFLAVGSTEDEDRDKDIIRTDGWDIKNFKKNPVIPWGHNYYNPPIGKAAMVKVDKEKKQLIFKPKFDADDDEAVKIFNKYKNGFLTSFSVGFLPKDWNFRDEEDRWYGGMEFIKQELLEISAVTVPANPKANIHMRSMCEEELSNLIQLGYADTYKKSDSGIYFPVREVSQYCSPNEIYLGKGVTAIVGQSLISEEENKSTPVVAYSFDPTKWDDKTSREWLEKNGPDGKQKIFSYSLKNIEESLDIELVSEEVDLFKYVSDEVPEETTTEKEITDEIIVDEEEDESETENKEDETDGGEPEELEEEKNVKTIDEKVDSLINVVNDLNEKMVVFESVDNSLKDISKLLKKSIDIKNESGITDQDEENPADEENTEDLVEFDEAILSPDSETNDDQMVDVDFDSPESLQASIREEVGKLIDQDSLGNIFRDSLKDIFGKVD